MKKLKQPRKKPTYPRKEPRQFREKHKHLQNKKKPKSTLKPKYLKTKLYNLCKTLSNIG